MNEEEVKLYKSVTEMQHRINELEVENEQAKGIIREYIRIAHEEFSNEFDARFANRDLLESAKQFLKEYKG